MPKHALSFLDLHNPFFMNGSNLGNKINAAQRGAKLLLDDERQVVWVYFKNKVSFIPLASVASADAVDVPEDVQALLGVPKPEVAQEDISGPPAVVRARRGRPPLHQPEPQAYAPAPTVPYPDFDPNDIDAAARHRELVRAASANANKPQYAGPQNDDLIQQTRNAAMGMKLQRTAQVQSAQQVGQTAAVTGKRKVMSHAELAAQVAKEAKE